MSHESATTAKRQTLGAKANIPPRRMDFDFTFQPTRYWYNNSPYLTTFWVTLSALFPEGETFFVDSVKNFRHQITDPLLKAQVAGFIGQEAMHSKEHQAFNELAIRQGFNTQGIENYLSWRLKLARKLFSKKTQLAITVVLEHYTALLAEELLRNPAHQDNIKDPTALKLWLWHALEENEHKCVAYDVYTLVGGGYIRRIFTMLWVSVLFALTVIVGQRLLLWRDGTYFDFKGNCQGFRYLWGKHGLFLKMMPPFLDFFRPSFHPSQHNTDELLSQWRTTMFSQGGLLAADIKNPTT